MEDILEQIEAKTDAVKIIRRIDKKINELNKLAEVLASGDTRKSSIQFRYQMAESEESEKQEKQDHGIELSPMVTSISFFSFGGERRKKRKDKRVLVKCDDVLMIRAIGVTVEALVDHRNRIIKTLNP